MSDSQKKTDLYIVLISVHGLIRGQDLELGRDADTGGQTLYVVELARALARHPDVSRVDLLTRCVIDPKVSEDYSKPHEDLGDGANLIRLKCGPRRYLRKEVLWPHLEGFIDQALHHVRKVGRVPDIVHSHYADAGYVGARFAGLLGVPLVHTGHSLGREKHKQLLKKGIKPERIEEQYNISTRIEAEEIVLGTADMVVASTNQEIEQQYAEYDNYHSQRMEVIPPGVDLSRFHPPDGSESEAHIADELDRFLKRPDKPMILALSRADERKNIASLVHAYGESKILRDKANLVIVAGNREDIKAMEKGAREVLFDLLYLIDRYDLYGNIAYPKHHESDDVPILYRLAASSKGIFVNPALTEPFGLTLIEAAASGVPVVATNDGGPKDILGHCHNGLLINPYEVDDIKRKLLDAMSDEQQWQQWSDNGVTGAHRHFSWEGHAQTYLQKVSKLLDKQERRQQVLPTKSRLPTVDRLAISAIDNALFGDEDSLLDLMKIIREHGNHIGYGIATGRTLNSALDFLKETELPLPDIIISSVGTEIHYCHRGRRLVEDNRWHRHIDYRWEPKALRNTMIQIPGLKLRPKSEQTYHKISYEYDPNETPSPREIKKILRQHDLHAKIITTEKKYLDLLPIRASKGLAIRYLAIKWGIPLDRILVVGDSGNDEEMLMGETLGVVVGNHSKELDKLKGKHRIYFAEGEYARGIIEGLDHYDFLGDVRVPEEEHAEEYLETA